MERNRKDGYPFGLVAVDDVDGVVGHAGLSRTSFGSQSTDDGPWLIGLCVAASRRKEGIGQALVIGAENAALAQGACQIFATTREAENLLLRNGWHGLRAVKDDTATWQVLAKKLV